MIVASHQPDLFPYTGFWHKMYKADLFDLKIYDQFVAAGYQRRVLMRGKWASIPVRGNPRRTSIIDVDIDPTQGPQTLANIIRGRYEGAPYWLQRGQQVLDIVGSAKTSKLWQFNLHLILGVRQMLNITTPISIAIPTVGRGSDGLVSVLTRYPQPVTYLSGPGARAYMGDCEEFAGAGIGVRWSQHQAASSDSILTALFEMLDPMQAVVREA